MQGGLQRGGIVGGEHGVHIEGEGHAGIAEFPDPLDGVEPSGQPDLVDILAERADVRDDVDVTLLRLLGARDRLPEGVPFAVPGAGESMNRNGLPDGLSPSCRRVRLRTRPRNAPADAGGSPALTSPSARICAASCRASCD